VLDPVFGFVRTLKLVPLDVQSFRDRLDEQGFDIRQPDTSPWVPAGAQRPRLVAA